MKRYLSRRQHLRTILVLISCYFHKSLFLFGNEKLKKLTKMKMKKKVKRTGLLFDDRYIKHTLGPGHPESPERLKSIGRQLKQSDIFSATSEIKPGVTDPMPYIKMIHSEKHIALVKAEANDESVCRLAVAGVLSAVDSVCLGRDINAFCAIRPPGHHAANRGPYGFCFYNNIAIAARYAQSKYKLKKILIIDWDYHHGDGTEWAFYDDPSVLFFSTHAEYAFPRTGSPDKKGKGKGLGFNINVPLPHNAKNRDIVVAFNKKLLPAVEKFKPELILVSAGFDSRKDDKLGDFEITDKGFETLTEIVKTIAKEHCDSKLVSMLEGGYNTKGLALAVDTHIQTLNKP